MVIPESAEVRREHLRRGNLLCFLPSWEYLQSLVDRLSQWVWDHYALVLVVVLVVIFLAGHIISWLHKRATENQDG